MIKNGEVVNGSLPQGSISTLTNQNEVQFNGNIANATIQNGQILKGNIS